MAIVRVTLATIPERDQNDVLIGECVFWYEWDNQAARRWVTAVGCNNGTTKPAYAEAYMAEDGTRKQSSVFLAGTNTSIAVPTGAAQRLQLVINPVHGVPDGVQFVTFWPSPI